VIRLGIGRVRESAAGIGGGGREFRNSDAQGIQTPTRNSDTQEFRNSDTNGTRLAATSIKETIKEKGDITQYG
jgi:hypothetical protein